jgi:hypothetical protein
MAQSPIELVWVRIKGEWGYVVHKSTLPADPSDPNRPPIEYLRDQLNTHPILRDCFVDGTYTPDGAVDIDAHVRSDIVGGFLACRPYLAINKDKPFVACPGYVVTDELSSYY